MSTRRGSWSKVRFCGHGRKIPGSDRQARKAGMGHARAYGPRSARGRGGTGAAAAPAASPHAKLGCRLRLDACEHEKAPPQRGEKWARESQSVCIHRNSASSAPRGKGRQRHTHLVGEHEHVSQRRGLLVLDELGVRPEEAFQFLQLSLTTRADVSLGTPRAHAALPAPWLRSQR